MSRYNMVRTSEVRMILNDLERSTVEDNCEPRHFMLRLHLLDHIVEFVEELRSLNILISLQFERYFVHIKHEYRCTS